MHSQQWGVELNGRPDVVMMMMMMVIMAIMTVMWFLTQFQTELGSGSHWEVAGAGVRQPGLPSFCLRFRLRGFPWPGAVALQQCRQAEGLPGRAKHFGALVGNMVVFGLWRVLTVCLQGEDVSMGIWMAAVGPQKYQVHIATEEKKSFHILIRVHGYTRARFSGYLISYPLWMVRAKLRLRQSKALISEL